MKLDYRCIVSASCVTVTLVYADRNEERYGSSRGIPMEPVDFLHEAKDGPILSRTS